jgi:hypothetical protein
MNWTYCGIEYNPTEEDLDKYYGFVYIIIDPLGKKYIGKKFFWRSKILPVTKTRKRKKRTLVESKWREYFGSNKELNALVEENGGADYQREILKLCRTKGECSYYEMKLQMENDVLLKPDEYYNAFIGGKIHRNHVLK